MQRYLTILLLLFGVYAYAGTPVLMYHDINNDPNDLYSVTPSQFAKQMKWLHDNGYRAIPLKDIEHAKPKDFVITFDDGYESFIPYALPVLGKYNWHATINIVGAWVGKIIPDIKDRKALSWTQIRMLQDTGLVSFGCHSYDNHHFETRGFTNTKSHDAKIDFEKFRKVFEARTGKTTNILAWPYGRYNDASYSAARDVGFRFILTSQHGLFEGKDTFHIPRMPMEKGNTIQERIHGH